MNKSFHLSWAVFLTIVLITPFFARAGNSPPNIVLIFCDDLGYSDIGCFGSEKHRTPHIDSLAKNGVKLTSFYSTCGVCTPSRSSLMTGCYPRRVNMHEDARGGWVLFPVAFKGLNPTEITMAEVLGTAGYKTACIGKWHLGDQAPFLPTEQGFDYYFGIPYSNDMGNHFKNRNYPPLPLLRNSTVIEEEPDQSYITKRYTEEAVNFIKENKNRPFFIYVPHTMPHNPVFASPEFAGKSANGGFGDSVEEIDWSTGQILKALKANGVDDRTLVIFTSDNGASRAWGGSNTPLSGYKGSTMEGGMRVPFVASWPGKITAGSVSDEVTSTIDLLPTFAKLTDTTGELTNEIDGHDISHILNGKRRAKSPHDAFYYYFRANLQAVRSGPWKLHFARQQRTRGQQEPTQLPDRLYNLDDDISESKNVAEQHPEVVAKLKELAETARTELGDGNSKGTGQREAGRVDKPVALRKQQ